MATKSATPFNVQMLHRQLLAARRDNAKTLFLEVTIPHGDTRLRPGDVVTTLCQRETAPAIKAFLEAPAVSRKKPS